MSDKVSIIIPSYNHSLYISETIYSVVQQTYKNIEIIIIDDGSSDSSCKLISAIKDSRIILVRQENQGAHAAINRGIEISTGEYIAILNSDDLFDNKRIEVCIQFSQKTGLGLIASYIEVIDSYGNNLGTKEAFKNMFPCEVLNLDKSFISTEDPIKNLLMFNYIATTSNFFFHRSIVEEIGLFYPLRYVHDWDYLLRMITRYPIHIIPEPLVKYRVHSSNTIKENKARMILEICWIVARNYPNILPEIIAKTKYTERFEFSTQLYNSIQVYGCEKIVLNLLLLFGACKNNPNMMDLEDILNSNNQLNQQFIKDIGDIISEKAAKEDSHRKVSIRSRIRKIVKSLTIKE